tara:strand:- start:253 stop:519 length:267 start_codon:yes stop_codon:yes gene_type:complete
LKFRIVEDTYKFNPDKQAHLGVSFGLFYFFLTYIHDVSVAIGLSVLVGVTFELYQGVSKRYNGCSYQDMMYNLIGIFIAAVGYTVYYG